jgi:hypothetical protein
MVRFGCHKFRDLSNRQKADLIHHKTAQLWTQHGSESLSQDPTDTHRLNLGRNGVEGFQQPFLFGETVRLEYLDTGTYFFPAEWESAILGAILVELGVASRTEQAQCFSRW